MASEGGRRRYAVLLCAEDSEYVTTKYEGYFGVFVRFLGEEGDKWDMYRVASGQFPSEDEVMNLDGFVVTGSCNDAHGNDLWILQLMNLLQKLVQMKKNVLGICFGHQILCRSLGGTTGRSSTGWDVGVTNVEMSKLPFASSLRVIECHQDEVKELPLKAEVVGRSSRTGIEVFKYGDNALGIQGHPEYSKDILLNLVDRLTMKKCINVEHAEAVKRRVDESEVPDREAWRKLCTSFLKGNLW